MFQVLIGILVIAALVIIGVYVYQKRTLNAVDAMLNQKAAVLAAHLDERFAEDARPELSGDSLKDFNQLKEEYQDEFLTAASRVDDLADQIAQDLHGFNLLRVKPDLRKLQDATAKLISEQQSLENGLKKIDDAKAEHQKAIGQLKKQYQQFRSELEENSYRYGKSSTALRQRLADLKTRFTTFTTLTAKGDYEAAQDVLSELQEDTAKLDQLIQKVPDVYKPLLTEFPTQLQELKEGYDQLKRHHYNFADDQIDQEIDQLNQLCERSAADLEALKVDEAATANDQLTQHIDQLYDVMQRELDARPKVSPLMRDVGRHLSHAKQQNRELIDELERLSLNYTLNNDELANARGLDEQLRQLQASYDQDQEALAIEEAIDSQVVARQADNEKMLTAIEEQQQQINDSVADLQSDEARAKKTLQKFSVEIRTIKRRVESLNLPGIPKDYLDYFFLVSDEIGKLADAVNQVKIDMEDITKQLLIVQDDLATLQEKTDDLRDSAELTERLIQYANRLSIDHEEINDAIAQAQNEFNRYNYPGSLEILEKAVEKVEPGSYKQMEQRYYAELKRNS
ncbi:septation ring formation regulator EzrA [Limosilactobacillus mucosae]|uniref:septation ring formation regulator EzrA n=1 Tax=Limosilactobacillus mucosae TaxID=97478 RepID=UPI00233EDFAC|nr:septation ring formation regulator EzrA [Limosilactobacillus mucosae]MDC2838869.1 septation ring formation regulator EzrA [Limosilactobacillus mucosae]